MTSRKPITIDEKQHASWCIVRPHADRTLDEVVVQDGASVHLEQMDKGLWWLAIYKDGQTQVVWFESDSPIHAWTAQTE